MPISQKPDDSLDKSTHSTNNNHATALWDRELIRKYDISGPRYTSYPTAVQLSENFTIEQWHEAAQRSNHNRAPMSLYFHIPFCDTICYYCGCNKIVTANKKRALPYIDALKREIDLTAQYLPNRHVEQIHFGGGTPTYLNDEQLHDIIRHTQSAFQFAERVECGIEVHPQSVNPERIRNLHGMGFNRLSMGIQDFDPEVQTAVNRFNSLEEVQAIINSAKACGFESLSVDLIYGLPKQTPKTFSATLQKVIALDIDRISLFNYAHMPNLFKSQAQIKASELPEPQEKLQMLESAIHTLTQDAGFIFIGMDHFAKPSDELALAQQNGTLQRNFQGYSTHGHCELLGLGVSSISSFGGSYIQNCKTLDAYYQAIDNQQLALWKGVNLTADDNIRRYAINEIICHFELDFSQFKTVTGHNFHTYFATQLKELNELSEDGLVEIDASGIHVRNTGRLLVRRICQIFDAYLQPQKGDIPKYSRII